MRRFALVLAVLLTAMLPSTALMAIVTDETPVIAIFASPTQGGGSCGIYVAWENQGPPLVDHWDVRNTMTHDCLALLTGPNGDEIWRSVVPASTAQTFVSADVIPNQAASFNWRRTTKLNDFSFGLSG